VRLPNRVRRMVVRGSRSWHRWRGPSPPAPPAPPACPPGWRTAPPDFVGLGAQKAGTSWWNALIHQHPAVARSGGRPKELHYFDAYWDEPFGDRDLERYASYFPRPDGAVAGEWTPGYLIDFWTPGLLARAAPGTRVLILLRDPVERFRSGLAHQADLSRSALSHRDLAGAFTRGLYAPQLRRVMDAFPSERVWVGQYEACRAEPAAQLAATFRFLGLPAASLPASRYESQVNPTPGQKPNLPPALRAALLDGYAPDLEQLGALVPGLDLSLWPSAREVGLA
jgi:hypothetical protein